MEVREEYIKRRDALVNALNAIDGVTCPMPKGAFYCVAKLPVEDAEHFCQWLLESFDVNGDTLMMAPGAGFYSDPNNGKDEVRLAYVLNSDDLLKCAKIIEEGLKAYPGIEVQETSGAVLVSAAAGEVWDELVAFCVQKNWGGLENLSLIPGTLSPEECRFEYRDSLFKSHAPGRYLIWKVHFVLKKSPHEVHTQYGAIQEELNQRNIQNPTIADIREVVCYIRQSKLPDPKKLPNGGSFFKNPVVTKVQYDALKEKHPNLVAYPSGSDMKLAAGWLIDNLGWKGKRMGKVGVHDKQALVLVNYEDGSGKDIYDLSQAIIQEVSQAYDVELEREVRVVTSS
ncbi:unnamed protein product [Cyprideis torosa]|uniref:UDP-N-acetylmuramate dehydrogenase n=1 Tax=Cyprideis torosa TaxID=163714 RepID=A0A7R8ZT11_9CRUS|nr:unnamed protein product [Cyprideis torosa]CAG0896910.1 unnamed protein product [Cyprideis torosa]